MAVHPCFEELRSLDKSHKLVIEMQQYFNLSDDAALLKEVDAALSGKVLQKYQSALRITKANKLQRYFDENAKAAKAEAEVKYKGDQAKIDKAVAKSYELSAANLMSRSPRAAKLAMHLTPLEDAQRAIVGNMHSQMVELMQKYKPKKLGFHKDPEAQTMLARAVHGEKVSDMDAMEYYKIWSDIAEQLRVRANRAGIPVPKLKGWAIPHKWDPVKTSKATPGEFYNDMMGWVDRRDMRTTVTDPETDVMRLVEIGDEEMEKIVTQIHRKISTDGLSDLDTDELVPPSLFQSGKHNQEHRFFHFKDADAWLAANQKYGNGTVYESMTNYIDIMSRDIAAAELLGPQSDLMLKQLQKYMQGKTSKSNAGASAKKVYDNVMGKTFARDNRLSDVMTTLRNVVTAVKLPFAAVSAVSDTFFTGLAAKFRGLPIMDVYSRFFKTLSGMDKIASERLATELGMPADWAIDRAVNANRYNEVTGYNWSSRWADSTMRATGLQHWTQSMKQSFQIEFLKNMNRSAEEGISDGMARALRDYGISNKEWDKIVDSPRLERGGIKFVDPTTLDDELQAKVVGMVLQETRYAAPEANYWTRALLNQGTSSGTPTGEMIRSFGQFKGFGVSVATSIFARGLMEEGVVSKLKYFSSLIIGTTVLGAFSYNAKQVLRGKSPLDPRTSEFWRSAMMQGGAYGIYGDLLFSVDRFGIGSAFLGPLAGDIELVSKIAMGTMKDVLTAEEDIIERIAARGVKLGKTYMPGQLWYTRLAIDRFLFDSLEKMSDSNWNTKQQQIKSTMRNQKGQSYWLKPTPWMTD